MRRLVVFQDGSKREITGEDGKYWLTGETRVRKLSDMIAGIEEAPEETAPAKSTAKKPSKKKKTEATEE